MSVRWLIASLAALLISLLGLLQPGAAEAHPVFVSTDYAYTGQAVLAADGDVYLKRGPPNVLNPHTIYDAGGRSSHGVSARPGVPIGSAALAAADENAAPAQGAQVVRTTREPARVADEGADVFECVGVAANAGLRTPQVLRVGDVKLPAVPKGAVGTPTQTGKGMEYAIPRGTPRDLGARGERADYGPSDEGQVSVPQRLRRLHE